MPYIAVIYPANEYQQYQVIWDAPVNGVVLNYERETCIHLQ